MQLDNIQNLDSGAAGAATDLDRKSLRPGASLSVAATNKDAVQINPANRTYDHRIYDELDHQLKRHRADLQALDSQLLKLDEAIDNDQKRLQEYRLMLEEKYRARTRLVAVRSAMARFVEGLQAKDAK